MSLEILKVVVSRRFNAPIALTYRAFTEPALLERWLCPSHEVATRVERCDPRPDGEYRFIFYFPGGRVGPIIGKYLVVEPPHKLVFTWSWEEPDPSRYD